MNRHPSQQRNVGPTSGQQRYDVATLYRCRPDVGPLFRASWDGSKHEWTQLSNFNVATVSRHCLLSVIICIVHFHFSFMNCYNNSETTRNEKLHQPASTPPHAPRPTAHHPIPAIKPPPLSHSPPRPTLHLLCPKTVNFMPPARLPEWGFT